MNELLSRVRGVFLEPSAAPWKSRDATESRKTLRRSIFLHDTFDGLFWS
jgi:hypothetical protein